MALSIDAWSAMTTFTADALTLDDDVIWQAKQGITGNAANKNPSQDPTNWTLYSVRRISSYGSLQAAIQLELNTQKDTIIQSIPLFVQLAESSFQTRIRAPIQRARVVLTVDNESKVDVPSDLLQVLNMRIVGDELQGSSLLSAGQSEILAGNFEEYIDLKRSYSNDFTFNSYPSNYDAPVYWFDNASFWIAPDVAEGTQIELYYYASIPQLGSTALAINSNGDALNAGGLTLAQWIAEGGSNTADNFVQDMVVVNVNWFIQAAPQMLLYGALQAAESFVKDDERILLWQAKFAAAEAETMELISRFEEGRAHTQQLYNAYSV